MPPPTANTVGGWTLTDRAFTAAVPPPQQYHCQSETVSAGTVASSFIGGLVVLAAASVPLRTYTAARATVLISTMTEA